MKANKVLVAVSLLFLQVIFLGFTYANEAFVMKNGKAAFPELHNVYIDPKSWQH
tara:strand:- start:7382 stop:7543 length:162 start_codon:yes stop_codon:yes gene_type:complete